VRSDVQVHKGLYGAIRVRGANEPLVDDERVLILDDVQLKADGTIAEYLDDMSRMMGREGNTLLVNGVSGATLRVRAGAILRLRLVNAANGRFFNLRLAGHTWRVVGHDGGLLAKPYDTEQVLVAPGERYDVLVIPQGAPGANLELLDDPYDRGHGSGARPALTVAHVALAEEPALSGRVLPEAFPGVPPIPSEGATVIPIDLDEMLRDGETVFTVNGKTFPDVPVVSVANAELRVLDVTNTSEMDHPFHLHGFFFQVFEKNGAPLALESSGNKDTVVVPAKGRLKLATRFDEPGHWMYHCHILEHAELGMMGEIHVE
jgi:FtsP/CotA-like multicopper oxidase with cupredoxin domain